MNPYININIENIKEKITRWCKVLFRYNDYVLIKLQRPEFVFGVGNIDMKYAIESTANDLYFYVYKQQIHYANKQITTAKSEAMENKLRELGYSIEPSIGYAEILTKDSVIKNIVNPIELFKIEKL
jgi:uncharacterized protein (DUF2164 family)